MIRPVAPRRSRPCGLREVLLAVVLAVSSLVLSGCVRVQAALAVSPRDTVSGYIVVATQHAVPESPPAGGWAAGVASAPADTTQNETADAAQDATEKQIQLAVPPDLQGLVQVSPYSQDGYVGSRLQFDGLSFPQLDELATVSPQAGKALRLDLRRVGDQVVVSGQADLTRLPAQGADVQLKMSVPGQVVSTDGDAAAGMLSWRFPPGQVTPVNATLGYPDPAAPPVAGWGLLLFGIVALAAAGVVLLARVARSRRPTRARRGY